jgi:acyl-coenzyme A synthetase/AMP-(fatty) acid ligase
LNKYCLKSELEGLDRDNPVLYVDGKVLTVNELLLRSSGLREKYPEVSGKNIALRGLSPLNLIEAIVAFDGLAAAMLLLPTSVENEVMQKLIGLSNCAYVLGDNQNLTTISPDFKPGARVGDATQWLIATSGTTGVPKIIEHSLTSLSRTIKKDSKKGKNYTWGLMYDPCRFAGMQVVLQALLAGSCLALPVTQNFNEQISVIATSQVNALSATPSLWRKLLMDGRVLNLPLKQVTLGGETADQNILAALSAAFPDARVVHIYASTEAGTGFAVSDGRAGFPTEWLDNKNAPVALSISSENSMLIKPSILPEGDEVASRLNDDGYLDTQDLVRIDGDRVLFIGRASGAINVGGNKVHPEEVERIIFDMPGVLDVRVFAKVNSMMGQLAVAEVVSDKRQDNNSLRKAIQNHCRNGLEPWQCPAIITFIDKLEETAAGKKRR